MYLAQWCALSVIKLKNKIAYRKQALVTIQKTVKMYLAQKKHKPRYQTLVKIRYLHGQVQQIGSMAKSLRADKDGVEKSVKKIQENINQVCQTIKGNEDIKKSEIEKMHKGLVDQINKELASVKGKLEKQKVAEEQAKLKKIQQEMEEERRKKEAGGEGQGNSRVDAARPRKCKRQACRTARTGAK